MTGRMVLLPSRFRQVLTRKQTLLHSGRASCHDAASWARYCATGFRCPC